MATGRRPSKALIVLVALGLPAGCRTRESADPVILSLGDQVVRRSEFERHVMKLEQQGGAPVDPTVRAALLDRFLEERVVVLEARARGLVSAQGTPEQEEAAARKVLADEGLSGVEVGDEEVAAYYQAHPDDFQSPETVALRQILVPTLNEARDVRRRLLKDPHSFPALAQTLSRAPEASAGGLMGRFTRGQLPPALDRAAFALAPGQVSEPVQTPFGFHVLRLDAKQPSRQPTLEESRDEIRSRLRREKVDGKIQQFVAGLMARAKVNHEAAQSAPHP
ncbi:MAG TPA: peptidyl-prolyl cis-trans isomerase [Vicinamibacteria bacterium]